jgi:hypothetical protein
LLTVANHAFRGGRSASGCPAQKSRNDFRATTRTPAVQSLIGTSVDCTTRTAEAFQDLDTDVIVAALRSPAGASAALLAAARKGQITLVANVALALEYEATCGRAEHTLVAGLRGCRRNQHSAPSSCPGKAREIADDGEGAS